MKKWRAIAVAGAAALGLAGCKEQNQSQGTGQSREQASAQASPQAKRAQQQPGGAGTSQSQGSGEPPHGPPPQGSAGGAQPNPPAATPGKAPAEIAGLLAQCPQGQILIRTSDGYEVPVRVGSTTQVVLNGQPAQFADIQPGSEVRASLGASGDQATRVEVTPPQGSTGTGGAGTAGTSSAPGSGDEWCEPLAPGSAGQQPGTSSGSQAQGQPGSPNQP